MPENPHPADRRQSNDEPASFRFIVVGASAGGLAALSEFVSRLPHPADAVVLAVLHVGPEARVENLLPAIRRGTQWRCEVAADGNRLRPGVVYLAPADHNVLLEEGRISVVRGPRENRWRPGIDPLFRSAAVAYGNKVIGVILTGMLDDGSAGLTAIKRCGGLCVVQDPEDATYPDMPSNAVKRAAPHHVVPLASMGALISDALQEGPPPQVETPRDLEIEAAITARAHAGPNAMDELGTRTAVTCPDCGGTLWEVGQRPAIHFRCHAGHSYGPESVVGAQREKLDETLWMALRMLEERKFLLRSMADSLNAPGTLPDRIAEIESHIGRLREVLMGAHPGGGEASSRASRP